MLKKLCCSQVVNVISVVFWFRLFVENKLFIPGASKIPPHFFDTEVANIDLFIHWAFSEPKGHWAFFTVMRQWEETANIY